MEQTFDLIVLGAGPGGYVAAIRAALEGKRVALIEKEAVGGVCLNAGCIPTKTLLAHAERWHLVKNAAAFGIDVQGASFNYSKMIERKDQVLARMRRSLEGLIASHKITLVKGKGRLAAADKIEVEGVGTLIAPKIILATGSQTRQVPPFVIDGKRVHDSTSILQRITLPQSIVIVGGGVIGCEFASLFAEFGVSVTLIEMLDSLLPMEAEIVRKQLTQAFTRKGIRIMTGVRVEGCHESANGMSVALESGEPIEAELVLVAVGRSFNTQELGLEMVGIKVDQRGAILVNDQMQTSVPSIYAIGDLTGKWLLAHVASHQGIVAALHACGQRVSMHYNAVPNVIFTSPEIATVGLSLEKAQEQGFDAIVGKFPFQALGKAVATLQTDGFAQVVLERTTHQILGAQVVGAEASSLIVPMVLAIQQELTAESVVETIHPHPTLGEIWMEATMIGLGLPIHMPPTAR